MFSAVRKSFDEQFESEIHFKLSHFRRHVIDKNFNITLWVHEPSSCKQATQGFCYKQGCVIDQSIQLMDADNSMRHCGQKGKTIGLFIKKGYLKENQLSNCREIIY